MDDELRDRERENEALPASSGLRALTTPTWVGSIHIQTIFHRRHTREVDSSRLSEVDSPFVGFFRRKIDMSIARAPTFPRKIYVNIAITPLRYLRGRNLANKYLIR